MSRISRILGFVLVFWLSLTAFANAALLNKTIGELKLQQLPFLTTGRNYHGYVPYRFRVTNLSQTKQHKLRLSLVGRSLSNDHLRRVTRQAVLSPGSQSVVTLRLPFLAWSGVRINVSVDRGNQSESYYINHVHRYYIYNHSSYVRVLASAAFPSRTIRFFNKAYRRKNKYGRYRYYYRYNRHFGLKRKPVPWYEYRYLQFRFKRTEHAPSSWYTHWLDYTAYAGVMMTGSEWDSSSTSVRQALIKYVEAGGSLFVVGAWKKPPHWKSKAFISSNLQEYRPLFGRVLAMTQSTASTITLLETRYLWEIYSAAFQSMWPFQSRITASKANTAFPVVKNVQIPVRGLFFLLLLFSILIGPVNFFFLKRRNKRILMLVTVPLLAVTASFVVFAYGILSEGWTGYSRTSALTYLDQTKHRAVTLGWKAYYFPLSLQNGLEFKPSTEIIPQVYFSSRGMTRGMSLDWTRSQHLASGWVQSRVPLHLRIRKNERRRERLEVRWGKDGVPTVINGLGADIKELWLKGDRDTKVYTLKAIAAGLKAKLKPSTDTFPGQENMRNLYQSSWMEFVSKADKWVYDYLKPNTYVAVLKGAPFVEEGSKVKRNKRQASIVIGRYQGGVRAR